MAILEQEHFWNQNHWEEEGEAENFLTTIKCMDGKGTVRCFQIFPGVKLFLNDFQAYHCEEHYGKGEPLQMNFCFAGRFECSFSSKECCILGPGDLSIHEYNGGDRKTLVSQFPLGYYQGIGIYLDCSCASAWTRSRLGPLAPDFFEMKAHLLSSNWYQVSKASEKCAHVFRELSELAQESDRTLLRLKIIELCFLLCKMPVVTLEIPYFSSYQVEQVKQIRERIVLDSGSYISLEQLSQEYRISVSQLQKIFKSLYGVPIYQYLREYRMEKAAVDLLCTGRSVTEIALDAGFTNPGKFAEAFKKRYGRTPTQYRIHGKLKTKME